MNKNEFIEEIKNLNIKIDENILEKLDKYCFLLQTWNKKFNLTSITDEKEIYLKHFYDSLTIVKTNLIKNNINLADIRTGAGFPGMVIAIFFNSVNVTLIESNQKKCEFLKKVKEELKLKNIQIINDRAEIYAKKEREKFDIVTCRAVSNLRIISELATPLIKVGGYFIPMKSSLIDELAESKNAFTKLNLEKEKQIEFKLPIEQSLRNLLVLKKKEKTNINYPREYKKIIKYPL